MEQQCMGFDFTDEFVDAYAEYTEARQQGRQISLDEHVARYPQFATRLRELCEFSDWLDGEFARFKKDYPDADLSALLGLRKDG